MEKEFISFGGSVIPTPQEDGPRIKEPSTVRTVEEIERISSAIDDLSLDEDLTKSNKNQTERVQELGKNSEEPDEEIKQENQSTLAQSDQEHKENIKEDIDEQSEIIDIKPDKPKRKPPKRFQNRFFKKTEERKEEIKKNLFYEKTLEELAEKLKSGIYKRIAIMAGAGISVSAGIPDFRTPGTGLYSRVQSFNLEYPEQVFEINYFKQNPCPFFEFSSELIGHYKPTLTHYFFKLLDAKNMLLKCYSQNIDGLEHDAGLPVDKLVQAHGHYRSAHCTGCHTEFPIDRMHEHIEKGTPAYCEICGCPAKPDVVFFGESLPQEYHQGVTELRQADLLIIIGTSLVVYPFAGLAQRVMETTPRVLINMAKPQDSKKKFKFDDESDHRDLFIQGKCDDVVQELIRLCQWEEEFNIINKS